MDSIEVVPKQKTAVTGKDYMTDYDSWLHIQVGGYHAVSHSPPLVPQTSPRSVQTVSTTRTPHRKRLWLSSCFSSVPVGVFLALGDGVGVPSPPSHTSFECTQQVRRLPKEGRALRDMIAQPISR